MKTPYKAVIFDFDDTLVKTREVKWRQFQAVAKEFYNIDLTEATLREHWGKPYDDIHRIFFQNADTIENMRQAKLSREADFPVELQPDATGVVSKLHAAGVFVGVLSASSEVVVAPDLKRLGFNMAAFSFIQTSEHTTVHKPDPAVFKPTLDRLAAAGIHDHIVYVGDALSDYSAASAAGLEFVGVTTGLTTAAQFRDAGAPHVIPRLAKLLISE